MTFNVSEGAARCGTQSGSKSATVPAVAAPSITVPATVAASAAASSPPHLAPTAWPEAATLEPLVEFTTSRGMSPRVDRRSGRIFGVKVLGLESRNGRVYRPEAIAAAAPLYENVKVNVNHPKGRPHDARDYQDRLGCLRNVRATADGLFGDLHFNPHHQLADQLAWDAEHAPENVGLSHNVQARTRRQGNQVVVESIECVTSVDLVADPATTLGLYESAAPCHLNAAPRHLNGAQAQVKGAPHHVSTALHEINAVLPPANGSAHEGGPDPAAPASLPGANVSGESLAAALEAIRRRLDRLEALQESRPYRPLPIGAPVSRGPEPPQEPLDAARWARLVT